MRRQLLAVIAAIAGLLVGVSPVFADTSLGETGTVGGHFLVDTSTQPGMVCQLKEDSTGYWHMKGIVVKPPVVYGSRDAQTVAWRLVVQRSGLGPWNWQKFYSSPRQLGVASVHSPADFTRIRVAVREDGFWWYRVRVKMFWYDDEGNVVGQSTHAVDYYKESPSGNVFGTPCGYD